MDAPREDATSARGMIKQDLADAGIDMTEPNRRLRAMVDVARMIEEASHEIAGHVTESFTDADGNTWARGPSAVSHAAKHHMQALWRAIARAT